MVYLSTSTSILIWGITLIIFIIPIARGDSGTSIYIVPNEQMQYIIDNDDVVKRAYESKCKDKSSSEKISTCLFDTLRNSGHLGRISKEYFGNGDSNLNSSGGTATLDQKDKDLNFHESKQISPFRNKYDPAIKKLHDYMYNKLQEAIYGEINNELKNSNGPIKVVDHTIFYDIFKNQIGKNIITSISSYCLDADYKNGFLILEDEIDATRSYNMKSLSVITGNQSIAFTHWSDCFINIQHICHGTDRLKNKKPDGRDSYDYKNCSSLFNTLNPNKKTLECGPAASGTAILEYSKRRACEVTRYIKGARTNMLNILSITDKIKEHDKKDRTRLTANTQQLTNNGYQVYNRQGTGNNDNINDLTTLSSNEFINESGYGKEINAMKKRAQECAENISNEDCSKYLYDKEQTKKLTQSLNEFSLKSSLIQRKIGSLKTKEELTSYLSKEGRKKEEIKQILKRHHNDIGSIVDTIQNNYQKEKDKLIESLKIRIEDKSIYSIGDSNNTTNTTDLNNAKKEKIKKISEELNTRSQQYQELIHFNNIVSGFLSTGNPNDPNSNKTPNTASIVKEMKDSAYDPQNRNPTSINNSSNTNNNYNSSNFKTLSEELDQQNLMNLKDDDGSEKYLQINSINEHILDY